MTAPRSVAPTVESQAVLAPLTDAAIFLVMTVRPGGEQAVRDLLEDVSGLQRTVGFRLPAAKLSCVTGIGSDLWDRLFPGGPRPAELHRFRSWKGPRHVAPSTPGDLLFHLRAGQMDVCFEMAAKIAQRLAGAADVVDETHGFKYFDERDLLGFVDGTENPTGHAAERAVLVGDEDPAFAGGSYVMVQKYVHDLAAWNALKVEDQEAAIGRTKLDNVEIEDKAPNSHVALNTVDDPDGNELKILRDNMPFGSIKEGQFGTYYIAYAATPDVPELMLRRMFLGEPYGNYDRILDFSTAMTGSLFYVPTADFLDDLPA
ncbi:peroxidase [Paractinoplanes deccanensis]|uniref:Peroxidase n=1 Tax=Paractinoplanes deccanensis TaxID=113561 RepID=A0ABQ3YJU9_9ACTN|nr:Dyp-type peroxidase [Actinoplanes deccanensis]GID80085.1 peroxidase [Actinoplanes deccanensis]